MQLSTLPTDSSRAHRVLAVDPALRSTGLAVLDGRRHRGLSVLELSARIVVPVRFKAGAAQLEAARLTAAWLAAASDLPRTWIVENPALPAGAVPDGWRSRDALAFVRGLWVMAAALRCATVIVVPANQWQGYYSILRLRRKQRLAALKSLAYTLGYGALDCDRAAAVLLGHYWLAKEGTCSPSP